MGDNPSMVEIVYTELVEAVAAAGLERWARHPKLSDAGKIRRALQVGTVLFLRCPWSHGQCLCAL